MNREGLGTQLARVAQALFLTERLILFLLKKLFSREVLLALGAGIFVLAVWIFQPLPPEKELSQRPSRRIIIPPKATFSAVADTLTRHGLLRHKKLFLLLGRLTGKDRRIRAGMFLVPRGLPPYALLRYLEQASPYLIKVTIPEGLRSSEIAGLLARKLAIDSARFMQLVRDPSLAAALGVEAPELEGYLLPDTYFFPWKPAEEEIIRLLVQRTLSIFQADSIQARLQELGMSIHQIITLASIIEGEVMVDSERVLVSSVYHNRLRRGWLLQADPTIQYILGGKPRRLTYRDLEIDSPYNTYRYPGLPPGPINNPGIRSILAALYPARTNYLYFVATGDGGHHFSRTQREHLYWKRKLDRLRRQLRRAQRSAAER